MIDLYSWSATLFATGLLILLFEVPQRGSPWARATGSAVCVALALRYVYWRILFTLPVYENMLQQAWSRVFLMVELATVLSSILVLFFMSKTLSRSAQADAHAGSPLNAAPTDVFIATYNESADILERTVVGALAISHPDLRVWLLDDGNRTWVKELAASLGVEYVARQKGKHAKAGNVNNGVNIALRTGRRPAFFLLLDADFVPHRGILARVLGLFDDSTVGIVQTPQHFFNPDPVQSNLLCSSVWPDEQRFFFNVLMPCKDAWGAAFCCGTSAVFRVAAFEAAGGMATETVTEDMLTSFKFHEFGYRTIFLNERLSLGLAPESLPDFISQRSRWCLGAIQQLFTRWSFHGRGRLDAINRIAFFDSVLYWISGAAFKLMLLSAPMIYWYTGTAALHAGLGDLVYWMLPMVVSNILFMRYLAGNRILPIMTDITQLLTAFVICRTVVTGLVRPFGRPFKVTAKGLSTLGVTVQWRMLWPYAVMAGLTVLGVFLHIGVYNPAHGAQGYAINVFWSMANAAVLTLAALACIELPHRRRDERFATAELGRVRVRLGTDEVLEMACTLRDISLGGAAMLAAEPEVAGWGRIGEGAELLLYSSAEGVELALPFRLIRHHEALFTVQFLEEAWIRHALIRMLFTGMYHRDVEEISARAVLGALVHTLLA